MTATVSALSVTAEALAVTAAALVGMGAALAAALVGMGSALAGDVWRVTSEAFSVLRCVGVVKAGAPAGTLAVMVRWLGSVGGDGGSAGGDGGIDGGSAGGDSGSTGADGGSVGFVGEAARERFQRGVRVEAVTV